MQGFAQIVLALLGLAIVGFILYFVGGMFFQAREGISGCLMVVLIVGGVISVFASLISLASAENHVSGTNINGSVILLLGVGAIGLGLLIAKGKDRGK